jgi:hypothetical protein
LAGGTLSKVLWREWAVSFDCNQEIDALRGDWRLCPDSAIRNI